MLRPFRLHEPETVGDAVGLLQQYGEEASLYAGGTELLLAMKEGLLRYGHLLNVKTIPGLAELRYDEGAGVLRIGSSVTHRALERSAIVAADFPLIAQTEGNVANVRVRNVGTIGGNLCFGEPHSDPGALLLLYDATVTAQGASGTRTFPLAEFALGPFETSLEEGAVLTEIAVPRFPAGMTGAYLKFGYHARPTVGVGVALRLDDPAAADGRGVVTEARVSVGSAGPRPVRVPQAEEILVGKTAAELTSPGVLGPAARSAAHEAQPDDDFHGSAEYKEHLIGVLLRRAMRTAIGAV